jgi:hypothetical protein
MIHRLAHQKRTLGSRLGIAFGSDDIVDEVLDVCTNVPGLMPDMMPLYIKASVSPLRRMTTLMRAQLNRPG